MEAAKEAQAEQAEETAGEPEFYDQGYQAAMADEGQKRAWLLRIGNLLPVLGPTDGEGDRVSFAKGQAVIAACERMVRIMKSDLSQGGA